MRSLKFGTSGLRGLVEDLVGWPSYAFTLAFLQHVRTQAAAAGEPPRLLIGHDLRASSPEILRACVAAAADAGFVPLVCGAVPTPALAFAALGLACPAVMITGSHIPDDRNGLKFYTAAGEITKADEAAVARNVSGLSPESHAIDPADAAGTALAILAGYEKRYTDFFDRDLLAGLSIGVYQHSSVARDMLADLLQALGAKVETLGRSAAFIPVDTEAHRPEDLDLLSRWSAEGGFDAIVSADGDADRPLVADERGEVLRGDVVGLLTARHLAARTIVTPVTSSSAMEKSGFPRVVRTRVGSPFVIAGMEEAKASGASDIVGFEANGGFLVGSDFQRGGRTLAALPTRDAALPILGVLGAMRRGGQPLSALVAKLDAGHAAAHRLQNIASDRSEAFLARLAGDAAYRTAFFAEIGPVASVDAIDGVRSILGDGSLVHFRASGNAPELRCYVEAESSDIARRRLDWGLSRAAAVVAEER